MDASTWEIVATVAAVVLMMVAALGIVFPVLPGSMLGIVTLLVWALVMGSAPAWTVAIIGMVLLGIGVSASWVLAGHSLKRQQIPKGPVLVGMVCAVIGMFVIPFFGLFIGFALGLLGAEWSRREDFGAALKASGEALKALGLGILIEFTCACLAGSALAVGILVHFLSG